MKIFAFGYLCFRKPLEVFAFENLGFRIPLLSDTLAFGYHCFRIPWLSFKISSLKIRNELSDPDSCKTADGRGQGLRDGRGWLKKLSRWDKDGPTWPQDGPKTRPTRPRRSPTWSKRWRPKSLMRNLLKRDPKAALVRAGAAAPSAPLSAAFTMSKLATPWSGFATSSTGRTGPRRPSFLAKGPMGSH